MAASKSFDIPIESSASGKPVRRRKRVAQLAEPAERRPRRLGRRPERGHRHQADDRDRAAGRDRLGVAQDLFDRSSHACSASPEVLTCKQTPGGSLERLRRLVERSQQLERVDGMDHPDHGECFLDLVGLQVSNQVPADRIAEVGQGFALPPELLGIVLAEVAGSAGDQGPDPLRRALLRHGDQPHGVRAAPRSPGRLGDPALDLLEIVPDSFLVHESSRCPREWPGDQSQSLAPRADPCAVCTRITGSDPQPRWSILKELASAMKPFLMILGFLAAVLIVSQLVMGLLILQGQATMRTAHQHSGYLTVAVTLIYIGWSLAAIASTPASITKKDHRAH